MINAKNKKKGKLIIFEGIDGSGKTTQLLRLYEHLKNIGINTVITKEPTSGNVGSMIRKYLVGELKGDNKVIAALFAADRMDHILGSGGLRELADNGVCVLCDRYYLSSYAYHSVDMDMNWVMDINRLSSEMMKPDLHILIDLSPDEAIKRIGSRGEFELYEKYDRLVKVRDNYYKAIGILGGSENVVVIDGSGTEAEVAERVLTAFNERVSDL